MSAGVTVAADVALGPDDVATLQADAEALLAHARAQGELSIHLCTDSEIRALNEQFRGKDKATDVLSFPQDPPLLGDVVISVQTARQQAAERGHGLAVELRVLLVHGLCHLLGHDHLDADQASAMGRAEARLLARLLGPTAPAGLVEVGWGG